VQALDLSDPDHPVEVWNYLKKTDRDLSAVPRACCDTVNRGLNYADGKVLFNTLDGYLIALDAMTGKVDWEVKHAYPDHGEGFCVIHDVAIAIRRLQKDKSISLAMTVDVDVHHGNGTAAIFALDPSVRTLSNHQLNNYPHPKPPSTVDINLHDGVEDDEYVAALEDGLEQALDGFQPDLIFYVAGADPYREDQLGGLKLSLDGLQRRDRLVFKTAREMKIPVAVTLAGGYARRLEDTIQIHANTLSIASEFVR